MRHILKEAEQGMTLKAAQEPYWILQTAVGNAAQGPVSNSDKQVLEKEVKEMNQVNDSKWKKEVLFSNNS